MRKNHKSNIRKKNYNNLLIPNIPKYLLENKKDSPCFIYNYLPNVPKYLLD
mgnify:CR=1 FL=1